MKDLLNMIRERNEGRDGCWIVFEDEIERLEDWQRHNVTSYQYSSEPKSYAISGHPIASHEDEYVKQEMLRRYGFDMSPDAVNGPYSNLQLSIIMKGILALRGEFALVVLRREQEKGSALLP